VSPDPDVRFVFPTHPKSIYPSYLPSLARLHLQTPVRPQSLAHRPPLLATTPFTRFAGREVWWSRPSYALRLVQAPAARPLLRALRQPRASAAQLGPSRARSGLHTADDRATLSSSSGRARTLHRARHGQAPSSTISGLARSSACTTDECRRPRCRAQTSASCRGATTLRRLAPATSVVKKGLFVS